jgi:hypothetical protein
MSLFCVKARGPFRYLSRWNRRAVVVYLVLLFCTWMGFFVMGMFPLHFFNNLFYLGVLMVACTFVLFLVWMTILISPGMPRHGKPWSETGARLAAAGGCFFLAGIAVLTSPHQLGLKFGGEFGVGLQPIRDLQRSPAVIALANGKDSAGLPEDQWPESIKQNGRRPNNILVNPSPPASPSLALHFGRGRPSVLVQNSTPWQKNVPDTYRVIQWAEDVWLCWNDGD